MKVTNNGQRWINKRIGKTGEKYISFDKGVKKFAVIVVTHQTEQRQKTIGRYKKIEDAIMVRDNYLNSL